MYIYRQMQVLYEDNHLIAAAKRSGQTVQPEPGKPGSLEEELKAYIKRQYAKPGEVFLGVIHRLDMPVSGIVLFARTSKALSRMNELFRSRELDKIYLAEVQGQPPAAQEHLIHYLKREEQKNMTRVYHKEVPGSQKAELEYELTEQRGGTSVLRIRLLSGRKHQIRAQLGTIGCPIVGDVKYGARSPLPDQSIHLHAAELTFMHPVKKEMLAIKSLPDWAGS